MLCEGPRIEVDGRLVGSFVAGLYDRPVVTGHAGEQAGYHLYLDPPAARRLLGVPLSELANHTVALDDLLGAEPETPAELERALARNLASAPPPVPELQFALGRIRATGGRVRVEALAAELGRSRRYLSALFAEHVGLAPKVVARLARAERAAALLRAGHELADVAYSCGYADQPHFNREFRAFTGATPGEFPNVQDELIAA